MSDTITPNVVVPVEPSKSKASTRKTTVTIGDIANARAKQRDISVDKAAKEVRGILRANFEVVCKLDPTITRVKERANDGNRWPAMADDVRKYVVDRSFRAGMNTKYAKRTK